MTAAGLLQGRGPTERSFVERREADWERLDALVQRARLRGASALSVEEVADFPPLYRSVCADLAFAEASGYGVELVASLHALVGAGHGLLYGAHAKGRGRRATRRALTSAWLVAFPRAVRERWRPMALAAALFFVPLAVGLAVTLAEPSFAYRLVPRAMLEPLTEAYAQGFSHGRAFGEDAGMAGFYVNNNVGIALRAFALGATLGLGTAFYLVQNGLSIGCILGYVASQGAGENLLTFVVGHGALELGAIVVAGGGGLSLGWSIVSPGALTRTASVQREARSLVVVVLGAAAMLLGAAAVEGFWSSSSAPDAVKRAAGAGLFVLVAAYFTFAGRRAP